MSDFTAAATLAARVREILIDADKAYEHAGREAHGLFLLARWDLKQAIARLEKIQREGAGNER